MNRAAEHADRMVEDLRQKMIETVQEAKRAQDLQLKITADEIVRRRLKDIEDRSKRAMVAYQEAAREAQRAGADRRQVIMFEEKAEAMHAYGVALGAAVQTRAPLAKTVKSTLEAQHPGAATEVMKTKAGRLTQAASLEQVIALTPKDPRRWDPQAEGTLKRARQYVAAADELNREDHAARARTGDRQGPASALREQITQRMNPELKRIQAKWEKTVSAAVATDGSLSARERDALRNRAVNGNALGVPPMPPVESQGGRPGNGVVTRQAQMVSNLESRVRTAEHTVPPRPSPAPTVGVNR